MFTTKYREIRSDEARRHSAIIISFFGGAEHYGICAQRLAEQCKKYNLCHDIAEYIPRPGEDWKNICRKKISFYTAKLLEHQRPVLWVDVDAQIIGDPQTLLRSESDFGAYLRNFKYFIGFDPMQFARLFHPGYLLLNYTPSTVDFVEQLRTLDVESDSTATDDYVLQEALLNFGRKLSFSLFSPDTIVFSNEAIDRNKAFFQHGDSGNVQVHKNAAAQHEPEILSKDRQKRILNAAASEELRVNNLSDAAVFLKRIRKIDPDDTDSLFKILNIYEKIGEDKKYRFHLDKAKKNDVTRNVALRFDIDRKFSNGDFANAARIIAQLKETASEDDVNFIKSRQFRYSFDIKAAKNNILAEDRVRMWWWELPYPGNLGDIINPYVVEKVSGKPPIFSKESPRMLGIGSIIKWARAGDVVWGAGASSASQEINPAVTFAAVRGPLTRQLVLDAGGRCEEVYGDPAWILPLIFPDKKKPKKHKLGVIRHFTHRGIDLQVDPDVKEIEILRVGSGEIEEFLDEMLSCEAIVSTSLHGVIIANAYGIPVKLAQHSGSARQIHGDGMKFDDYFLSIGRTGITALDLSNVDRISTKMVELCTDNPAHSIDIPKLLRAAPFKLSDTLAAAIR